MSVNKIVESNFFFKLALLNIGVFIIIINIERC